MMEYEFSILFYPRIISGLIALWLVFFLWPHRKADGAIFLILFEIAAAIWAITDGFEHAAINLADKLMWTQIGYVGITTSAPLFFLFSLEYTQNYKFINRRLFGLLSIIPIITIILAITNSNHHLIWTEIELIQEKNLSIYHYGSWFWFFAAFEYIMLLSGILILVLGTLRFFKIYKSQIWVFIISSSLPLITSTFYIFKLSPVKGMDFTPLSFIISGLLIAISVYWFQIFKIMPVARKKAISDLSDGIAVIDMANRIVEANPAFCKITSTQSERLIGTSIERLPFKIIPDNYDATGNTDFAGEICLNADNETHYYEIKINPVKDRLNQIGLIIILNDITAIKRTIKQMEENNQLLIKEIDEKEKLIKDLDAYARSVAHDLKSPLGGIIGLTDLIKLDYRNNNFEEAIELLDLIKDQGNKMCNIVDELLLLSRIRKEDFKPEKLDMQAIVNEAIKRQGKIIKESNAIIEIPGNWPSVFGHPQWVEEIWANLINNAIKYGGNPPKIVLGFEREDAMNFRFWVRDNGNGLPAESLEKVFRDFERLGMKNVDGNGLGLSIIKRIIEKLGGTVDAGSSNKPGEGCVFSFTLSEHSQNQ